MEVTQNIFGEINGKEVLEYSVKNDNGMEVAFINFGCIITKLLVPDAKGTVENVVLGFDTIEEYIEHSPYFGAVCGRVAGRIDHGKFQLNGESFQLPQNDGANHLHGGFVGLDSVIWNGKVVEENNEEVQITFTYESADGEEGYPGNLKMSVTYVVSNDNELVISYEGVSDKDTLLNVTNHSYFNLSGDVKRDILHHELTVKSDKFLELGSNLIPTGTLLDVEGTAFDFRQGRKIQDGVSSTHEQNVLAGRGYDHPLELNTSNDKEIILKDEETGRVLTVETTEPCLVLYTSNMMGDNFTIRGVQARKYLGVCLETQKHPDAIHHAHFPSIVLEKGETYKSETKFAFTTI
ncbi:aldose epimerase family protein [Evansella sp. AB-rgal1]|uniref:aldose epimerase family protein n=1 Tax=Evansella sp. AB-rgal1 TaxID=3242696 RepID=UPI00359D7FAD